MRRVVMVTAAAVLTLTFCAELRAHDVSTTPITWNREISRIFYERCVSCHRPGGTSFSLMTYPEVQPRAVAIRDAVLSRQMPPWGAVKGFGDFRNDEALTAEQIELITDWVQDDTPKGNNPRMLPAPPKFTEPMPVHVPPDAMRVGDTLTLTSPVVLDGLLPERVTADAQIVAVRPNGVVEPLVWLYGYSDQFRHPFLLRKPITLPAGTIIRGVKPPASLLLLPVTSRGTR
jgi:mono/diheme cytochrome c family protein